MTPPKDANGVVIKPGMRVRLTATVELTPTDGHSIRIRPDRQPEGYDLCPFVPPRVLEVLDE